MKRLAVFFFSFVLLFLTAHEISAIGENSVWCDSFCNTTLLNCDPGYIVPSECRSLPEDCCYTIFGDAGCPYFISCVPEPEPEPDPPPRPPCFPPNLCFRYECPGGYNITSDICSYYEDVCCRPEAEGTATPTPSSAPVNCYDCVESVPICIPRSFGDPRCEYPNEASCNSSCLGGNRYSCDGVYCVADTTGPFGNLDECTASCGGDDGTIPRGLSPKLITCPGTGSLGFDTAIGCIPLNSLNAFSKFTLSWSIGIAGGIAFLLIVYSGFMIMTSTGDPKRLQAGRELLTAAITGLLLLIFAAFILRLVGVELLGLPEFGG